MTIDFVQIFGSMSHAFYNPALKKYSFGDNFIDWINITKESRIMSSNWRTLNQIF